MTIKHIIILLLALTMSTAAGARDKNDQKQKLYMFGMAASFTDTIVHFTQIQEVSNAWMDKKKHFLLGRQEYSYQLRDYMAGQLGLPQRTCIVIYEKKLKKAEKKRARMIEIYNSPTKNGHHNDVRYIHNEDFKFSAVDMSEAIEQERLAQEEQKDAEKPAKKKKEKKKDKKDKKGGKA